MFFRKIMYSIFMMNMFYAPVSTIRAEDNKMESVYKLIETMVANLNNDNAGIVESTIFNLISLKGKYPERDFSLATKALGKLAFNGENPEVRYMAYIATSYLTNPDWVPWLNSQITELEGLEEKMDSFQIFREKVELQLLDLDIMPAARKYDQAS